MPATTYKSGRLKPHVDPELGIVDTLNAVETLLDAHDSQLTSLAALAGSITDTVVPLNPPTGVVVASSSSGTLAVSFTDPNMTSVGYALQYRLSGTTAWTLFSASAPKVPLQYITGLTNGVGYDVQVAAVGAAGQSLWSATGTGTPQSGVLGSDTFASGSVPDSTKWTVVRGTWAVASGKATGTPAAGAFAVAALLYSGMPAVSDTDVTVEIFPVAANVEQYPAVAFNWDGVVTSDGVPQNGYWIQLSPASNTIEFARFVGGLAGYTILATPSYTFTGGTTLWVRLIRQGNGLSVYVWNDPAAQPSTPTASLVDSTPYTGTGKVGLFAINDTPGNVRVAGFDNFTVNTPTGSQGSGSTTVTNPSGVAMPTTDLTGWKLVTNNDFNINAPEGGVLAAYSATLDAYPTSWHDTSGAGDYNPALMSTTGSMLVLHCKTVNGRAQVHAPVPKFPSTNDWNKQLGGRYAFRFKADTGGTGYKTAWLLWPDSYQWSDGELDFPEGSLGGNIGGYTHVVGNPSVNSQVYSGSTNYTSAWHTGVIEWIPKIAGVQAGSVKYILDGTTVLTDTGAGVPSTSMHFVFQTETDGGAPGGSVDVKVYIDWYAIYAYQP